MDTPRAAILVDLDCLFDTRITTLIKMDEDVATTVLSQGYSSRPIESYPGIPYSEFKKEYDKRDKHTLAGSPPTAMMDYINVYLGHTIHESLMSPNKYIPKIIVNTYPYDLTHDEERLIVKGIVASTNGMADVECVHLPLESITPSFLRNQGVALFIYYEYYMWFETHAENGVLDRESCPEIGMLGPKIVFEDTLPSEREMEQAFKEMVLMAQPFIQLELVSVSLFSVPITLKKKE